MKISIDDPGMRTNITVICSVCFEKLKVKEITQALRTADFNFTMRVSVQPHKCKEEKNG